jgi:hypothetical protein
VRGLVGEQIRHALVLDERNVIGGRVVVVALRGEGVEVGFFWESAMLWPAHRSTRARVQLEGSRARVGEERRGDEGFNVRRREQGTALTSMRGTAGGGRAAEKGTEAARW